MKDTVKDSIKNKYSEYNTTSIVNPPPYNPPQYKNSPNNPNPQTQIAQSNYL